MARHAQFPRERLFRVPIGRGCVLVLTGAEIAQLVYKDEHLLGEALKRGKAVRRSQAFRRRTNPAVARGAKHGKESFSGC